MFHKLQYAAQSKCDLIMIHLQLVSYVSLVWKQIVVKAAVYHLL